LIGSLIGWFFTATANTQLSRILSFPQAKMVIGMHGRRMGAQPKCKPEGKLFSDDEGPDWSTPGAAAWT
jgi:hypothetical protein